MNTFLRAFPETAKSCRYGCGMCTVLVDQRGDGVKTRVHCGTYRVQCPQEPPVRNEVAGRVHGTVQQFGDVIGAISF